MIPKEIFQKIRRIEITTSRLVTDVFAGEYHSVFKGLGMEFDEVREYFLGDDIRTIDWNVTARTGSVHVKKYVEERELTVMLLVDVSASSHFASVNDLKSKLAAEVAAVLAFAAIRNNDRVGLIMFTDKIEKYIPPRKGTRHVLRVIREVLYYKPENQFTNIPGALEYLSKIISRKAVAFLISDFFDTPIKKGMSENGPELKKAMAIANKRHDLIAVTLNDPREIHLPSCGLVSLQDLETGEYKVVDSTNSVLRKHYYENALKRLDQRNQLFNSIGVDHIDIKTNESYAKEMIRFFLKRKRKRF